jgi:hypothetical protein
VRLGRTGLRFRDSAGEIGDRFRRAAQPFGFRRFVATIDPALMCRLSTNRSFSAL